MSELVPLEILAHLIQMSAETLKRWKQKGRITLQKDALGQPLCVTKDFNTLLAQGTLPGFTNPPTVDDLMNDRLKLLTSKQAARTLKVSVSTISNLAKEGKIEGVKIGKATLRVTASSVDAMRKKSGVRTLTRQQAAHVLGLTVGKIHLLANQGLLTEIQAKGGYVRITLDSILILLTDFLPKWIPPRIWVAKRLASECGYLTIGVLRHSRKDYSRLYKLMAEGKLPYIAPKVSGERTVARVPADMSLGYCQKYESRIENSDWARLFGVDSDTLMRWDANHPGWRTCQLHPHKDATTYLTCAIVILGGYVNESANRWLQQRLGRNVPALDEATMMRRLNIKDLQEWRELVRVSRILELRTPDGERRYSPTSIKVLRARLRKAARSD